MSFLGGGSFLVFDESSSMWLESLCVDRQEKYQRKNGLVANGMQRVVRGCFFFYASTDCLLSPGDVIMPTNEMETILV